MNEYQEALAALNEADECYQPETLEDLSKYFPVIREALEILGTPDYLRKEIQPNKSSEIEK